MSSQRPSALEPGGGFLGAAVSEEVNLPTSSPTALAIAGAFLLAGGVKERICLGSHE